MKNQQRMGPLTLTARRAALARVLSIQQACNDAAREQGRPLVDLINEEELARINELIAAGTYPNKWDGSEPGADEPMDSMYADGSVQPLLFQIGKATR